MAYEALVAFVLALGALYMVVQLVLTVLLVLAIIKIRNVVAPKIKMIKEKFGGIKKKV